MKHLKFASPRSVSYHLDRMEIAGLIKNAGKARSLQVACVVEDRPDNPMIPVYGPIRAGHPELQSQLPLGMLEIPPALFSSGVQKKGFALTVKGDSMEGAGILDGDLVIIENSQPREGDIVAALIDGESTLKRLVKKNGTSYLKAENPKYRDLIPAAELVIQGVAVGSYRKF